MHPHTALNPTIQQTDGRFNCQPVVVVLYCGGGADGFGAGGFGDSYRKAIYPSGTCELRK